MRRATRRLAAAWPAVTGTGAAASVALALLVMICAFVAVAVPRASLASRTRVLQRAFQGASSSQTAVLADADITGLRTGSYLTAAQLAAARAQLAAGLHRGGLPLAPRATQWAGLTTGSSPFTVAGQPPVTTLAPPQLELLYRSGLDGSATLASGSWPGSAVRHGASVTLQVAVTSATAARLGLRAGSRIREAGQVLMVTGIIAPRRAGSSFWTEDPVASAPRLVYPSLNSAPHLSCGAFVSEAELPELPGYASTQPLHGLWSFPLILGQVSADHAAGMERALQSVSYLTAASTVSVGLTTAAGPSATIAISLSSGLVTTLQPFVATDDAVQRVLSLLFVSLAFIAAVVVLLGALLVAQHRHGELAMMRARGASLRQLAAVALGGGAAAILPAAAVAIAAAVAVTPGPSSWLSWWLAGSIIVAALASPPLLALWRYRGRRGQAGGSAQAGHGAAPAGADGAGGRAATARRWTADAALVCGSVAGLILLRQQGLPPPGQLDVFISAAPVLAAVPVALIVMRVYPFVLRQLTRLAGRRRGVVMVVGLARSTAAGAGLLPAFALVLSFAVIAFGAMARGAVIRADVAASWQAAGADAVVAAPPTGSGIAPAALRQITGVPGAARYAAVTVTTGTSGQGESLPVIIVDPRQYAALTAATPLPPFPAAALAPPRTSGPGGPPGSGSGPVPILVSPAGRAIVTAHGGLFVAGRQLRVRVASALASIAGGPAGSQFAVVPRWALGKQAPVATAVAIAGPRLDTAALIGVARRAVPRSRTTLRSGLLAAISDAPLPHGGFVTFAQGIAAAGAFSLLVLVLTLVLGARSRELTLARLSVMGLGPAQTRWITALEVVPAIAAAAAGGAACTLALVPLIGPSVNLAAFTGMPVTAPLHASAAAIGAAAGGLLLLTGATLAAAGRLARRRALASALRASE